MAEAESSLVQTSQTSNILGITCNSTTFSPKLYIKLQESNFLLWNNKWKGVILSNKLHRVIVNSQIPPMFKKKWSACEHCFWRILILDCPRSISFHMATFHHLWSSSTKGAIMQACMWGVGQALQFPDKSSFTSIALWIEDNQES